MRLRSVSSGLFTGIPSLHRTIRLFQTLHEANRTGVLNSYSLISRDGLCPFSLIEARSMGIAMLNQFSRTELIFGKDAMLRLFEAKVAVFGIGGVGGYAVEALARSGVGALDLFDDDKICLTNLNRQIHALWSNIGQYKVDAAKERVLGINPAAVVGTHRLFYVPETSGQVDLGWYDYVIDAIDTVSGKIELAVSACAVGVPIISSMGAGNKVDASAFEVADIYKTSVCPLAKVMRHELRRRGVGALKVVYSKETPVSPKTELLSGCRSDCVCPPGTERKCTHRRQIPGSNAFVPAAAGLIIAGEVVRELIGLYKQPAGRR